MKDLAYTSEEMASNKEKYCCAPDGSGPKYPWGLSLSLETETLKRLGKSVTDFKVGTEVPIMVMAKVTSISMSENAEGGKNESVGLIAAQMDFNDAMSEEDKAAKMYGTS